MSPKDPSSPTTYEPVNVSTEGPQWFRDCECSWGAVIRRFSYRFLQMMKHREIPAGTVVCGLICCDNVVDYQVKGTVILLICFQAGVGLVLLVSLGWAIEDSFQGLPFFQLVPVHDGVLKGDSRELAAYVHRLVWSSGKGQLILRYPGVSIWKVMERNQTFSNHCYSQLAQHTKIIKGEKEWSQLTNPSEKQKENPGDWHFQGQLDWTPETVTGTWATVDKDTALALLKRAGGGGQGLFLSWWRSCPVSCVIFHVPAAKDLSGTRSHQNICYSSSITFPIGNHSPKLLPCCP